MKKLLMAVLFSTIITAQNSLEIGAGATLYFQPLANLNGMVVKTNDEGVGYGFKLGIGSGRYETDEVLAINKIKTDIYSISFEYLLTYNNWLMLAFGGNMMDFELFKEVKFSWGIHLKPGDSVPFYFGINFIEGLPNSSFGLSLIII